MSVSMSGKAIGALTQLIKDHIVNVWNDSILQKPDVTIGRPEAPLNPQKTILNLFLYELKIDPFLRNTALGPGREPPVWLVAKYLLTAFDSTGESDTMDALRYLGEGIRILASLTTIRPQNMPLPELESNPETLKLTIEDVGVEMLSRLMQGPDQKFRSSIGFEVRPIMIDSSSLPSYSLLVGIDYTKDPLVEIGEEGIKIDIDSLSIQPVIVDIEPKKFELGNTLYVKGRNLDLPDLSIYLNSSELDITSQGKDGLECLVDFPGIDENSIVAGNYTIYLIQKVTNTRQRKSNAALGSLIPKIDSTIPSSLSKVTHPQLGQVIVGNINIVGNLLGRQGDDVVVGLYRDARTTNVITKFTSIASTPPAPPQHNVILQISITDKVLPGVYRLIYTVNGQQAKSSPQVRLDVP
jgi:hypothetical protein